MKTIVEFLLLFLAAVISGIFSVFISNNNFGSIISLLLLMVFSLLVVLLMIFWDEYEKPNRTTGLFFARNAHTNTIEILKELKDIRDTLHRKLNEPIANASPHPDKKR